jgi:hypothetical protein
MGQSHEPELIEGGQACRHLLTGAKGARLASCTTCARTGEGGKGLLDVVGLQKMDIRTTASLTNEGSSTYEDNARAFESDVLNIDMI